MTTNKIPNTLRLDDETISKLKEIALKENRSLNNLIETILKNYLMTYSNNTIKNSNIQIGQNTNIKK